MKTSPRITNLSWGAIQVEGREKPYKDAKVFPGGSREWDWNETGTHHEPGILPADVKELIDNGAKTIVLSKGINERLRVSPDTLSLLLSKHISVYVLQTEKAVEVFNRLCEEKSVGGLFHSTC